jgi:hypothetical protein
MLLASLTYPSFIFASKDFSGFTVRLADPFLFLAFGLALRRGATRGTIWPIYVIIFFGLATAAFNATESQYLFLDLQGPAAIIAGFSLFSKIESWHEAKLVIKYISVTLWISVSVELLIYSGIFASNYALRSSFAGELAESSGIGRLVTPTHILAVVTMGIALASLLAKQITLKAAMPLIAPSSVIVALAGTRLSLIFILLTILGVTLGNNKITRLGKVLKRIVLAGAVIAATLTVASYVWENLRNVIDLFMNFVLRTLALSPGTGGTTDASALYREFEISHGIGVFFAHPAFGLGFGGSYLPKIVNDESWLGIYGPIYTHNIYLWLAVKVGAVGIALFALFVSANVATLSRARSQTGALLLASVVALLFVGFVWNLLVNVPDSLVFGALIGALTASYRLQPSAKGSLGGVFSEK